MGTGLKVIFYTTLLAGTLYCGIRFGSEFVAASEAAPSASKSHMMAWLGGFLAGAVLLALRIAWDLSRFLGSRAENYILQGEPPPALPDELSQADEFLKQRRPLEAVNLLRDYLDEHPREHYVQYRIAEIYTDQIKNPLAAALEYEALLLKKLDAERWGWTAIRLARLYRKLREFDKADALLQRVVTEHEKTSASHKAEKLLDQWGG